MTSRLSVKQIAGKHSKEIRKTNNRDFLEFSQSKEMPIPRYHQIGMRFDGTFKNSIVWKVFEDRQTDGGFQNFGASSDHPKCLLDVPFRLIELVSEFLSFCAVSVRIATEV